MWGLSVADVTRQLQEESHVGKGLDSTSLIALVGDLERLKSTACAIQAACTSAFAALREAELAAVPCRDSDRQAAARRDIGAQIGLARRVGPRAGTRLVGMAKVLTGEMPATMSALREGRIDEYQAMLVVAETATLSLEHRRIVDAELAPRFGAMTAVQARGAAARIGYGLDPDQAVRRHRKAVADRRVTLRPAPDCMTYLTALLPMVEGVAAFAALTRDAGTALALGDPRGQGALMADNLVDRLTGSAVACDTRPSAGTVVLHGDVSSADVFAADDAPRELTAGLPGVPPGTHLEIQLVMTDRTLFDGDSEPALVTGYGAIPAPLARHLVRSVDPLTRIWMRRLFADGGGRINDADSRRRLFPQASRQVLVARDQVCRTPWCGAPIRHADHSESHARGGPTQLSNGAGLCVACNQVKEGPGWTTVVGDDGGIITTTPTGHRYRSDPPPAPRSGPWDQAYARPDTRSMISAGVSS